MNPSAMLAAAHGSVTTAQDISIGHLLLQMVVALAIVVGGIWGFGKIMKKSGRGKGGRRGATFGRARGAEQDLTLLSRQQVGKGKSIAVVQAGDQCFLVGIADSGLTPLGELKTAGGGDESVPAGGAAVAAEERRSVAPATGERGLALAPLDLGSIDLAAFAGSGVSAPMDYTPARVATAGGRSGQSAGTPGPANVRAWLDALREATVRR